VFWLIPALNFSTMELDDSLFAPSCAGGEKALIQSWNKWLTQHLATHSLDDFMILQQWEIY